MPKDNIKIAVITPTYNYGKYFAEYVESIFRQSRKPERVVIIDDKSTDDTYGLIRQYFSKDIVSEIDVNSIYECGFNAIKNNIEFNVRSLKENGGPSIARNVAIKEFLSNTDIFALCDMDDIYYPEKISKSLEVFKRFSHVAVVYSDYDIYNTQTEQKTREYKDAYSHQKLMRECIVSNNSLIAARILEKVGIYDETLRVAEDYDLWLRIAEHGIIYHIPESLYEYKVTGEGATFSVDKETWQNCWKKIKEKQQRAVKA